MKNILSVLTLLLCTQIAFAQDPTLPPVENLQIDGDVLTWDPLSEATGYNISLNQRYHDTVRNATTYRVTESGSYRITPFNDNGEFGSDYGLKVDYQADAADNSVQYSFDFNTLIVYKTCTDVGPGESCTAQCPNVYEPEVSWLTTQYIQYMSGGACTTSDIVEADSWASHFAYQCTVPTYSGEVTAQAICVFR